MSREGLGLNAGVCIQVQAGPGEWLGGHGESSLRGDGGHLHRRPGGGAVHRPGECKGDLCAIGGFQAQVGLSFQVLEGFGGISRECSFPLKK